MAATIAQAPQLPRFLPTCPLRASTRSRPRRAFSLSAPRAMSTLSRSELQSLPGVQPRDPATKGFTFQQTMLRVKDPKDSLNFYTRVLGMTLLCKLDFADMKFSLYFLGMLDDPSEIPEDPVERAKWMCARPACLELTHNWGTESDPEFKGYANGNSDPGRGFGHIGFCVPTVAEACKRFDELGVKYVKRPEDGKMKNLAFIQDPDGYWIEILEAGNAGNLVHWPGNQQQA